MIFLIACDSTKLFMYLNFVLIIKLYLTIVFWNMSQLCVHIAFIIMKNFFNDSENLFIYIYLCVCFKNIVFAVPK